MFSPQNFSEQDVFAFGLTFVVSSPCQASPKAEKSTPSQPGFLLLVVLLLLLDTYLLSSFHCAVAIVATAPTSFHFIGAPSLPPAPVPKPPSSDWRTSRSATWHHHHICSLSLYPCSLLVQTQTLRLWHRYLNTLDEYVTEKYAGPKTRSCVARRP